MTKSHRHYEFGRFQERLEHFCVLFEIDPPEILYEDGEPTLTDLLMEWIKETNANMDWLFAGSPCAMLRAWAKDRASEREMLEINRQLEPDPAAGNSDPAEDTVMRFFEAVRCVENNDVQDEDPIWEECDRLEDLVVNSKAQSMKGAIAQLDYAEYAGRSFSSDDRFGKVLFENIKSALKAMA